MTARRLTQLSAPLALVVLLCLGTTGSARAQGADIIRGRVIGPDSTPIERVTVTATSISGNVSRQARTDRNGRFTIVFPGGDGDYMVSFQALGYGVRRFQVKRTADQEVLVADARLQYAAQELDAVQIAGERNRVNRNDNTRPDISGTERTINPGALAADQQGNLAALAASLPGVQFIPGADGDPSGFSVLGLTQDQNATTLNGLSSGVTDLPRDAAVSTSLVTTPYDVSRGGFSGGQLNVRSRSGSNFLSRSASLNLDAPALQWTDAAGRALAQEYSNFSLGGAMSGPIEFDKSFYNLSYQVGRRGSDLNTLLSTSALGLQTSGIAADSVARLLTILQAAQIPVAVGGIPSDRTNDNLRVFGALDWAPPSSLTGQALNVSFNANVGKQAPVTGMTSEVPAYSGERTSLSGGLQLRHTNFYGVLLSETSFGMSGSNNAGDPYVALPAGSVLINSTFSDGTNGVRTIAFGGNPSLDGAQGSRNIAFVNTLSWFSLNNRHRLKLTTELRRDAYTADQNSNMLGTFRYNSLADLESDLPASFTRVLQPREQSGSQWVAGASLGDAWRVSSDFQLQYGVRVDANRFNDVPERNPLVEGTFGARNDLVPNGAFVSPRLGFSWTYGTAPQIAGFEGAVRGPRAVVRGGVGVFQNSPGTRLPSGAINNTGLAGALQSLSCTGAATPVPDWANYGTDLSSVPVLCADGTMGTVFANSTPNVTLFAEDYRPQRSIRSNLQWNGPVLDNRFTVQVEATYSLNQHQPSSVDLNFVANEYFALAEEGGRPVFVQPTAIVPATGAIAPGAARLSDQFARVSEQRSDLDGISRQLSFRVSPSRFSTGLTWSVSYVLSDNRAEVRGFQNTAGDPRVVEWARNSFNTRHQLSYSLGYNLWDAVRVSWSGSFRSGNPYTPVISGDVNGDGYSNDRAFIFDPATATDPAVAAAMQALLASTGPEARKCLRAQLGTIASRNSCDGPWTQSAVLNLSLNPLKFRLPQRATLSLSVSNPLGAADLLLHGSDGIKGWGQQRTPDPVLLYVRGFDDANQRFVYDVNQRFGNTSPRLSAFRAPVAVTAMMRFDLGPTRERQMLHQTLDRGRTLRGTKAAEPQLRAMFGSAGLQNPMAAIMRQVDSLRLTSAQADSLATMNRWYLVQLDRIWAPLVKDLATLPDAYDRQDTYRRYVKAREGSVDLLLQLSPRINQLLTREQKRKLPAFIASYLDPRYLASIRSGTAGAGFAGGGGVEAAVMAARGGGGVEVRIP